MRLSIQLLWPPVFWAVIIAALCAIPGKDLPSAGWMELVSLDKWVHGGIFFIEVILLHRALLKNDSLKSPLMLSLVLAIPYGGILELLQEAVFTDRTADWLDFTANTAGCLLAAWWITHSAAKQAREKEVS